MIKATEPNVQTRVAKDVEVDISANSMPTYVTSGTTGKLLNVAYMSINKFLTESSSFEHNPFASHLRYGESPLFDNRKNGMPNYSNLHSDYGAKTQSGGRRKKTDYDIYIEQKSELIQQVGFSRIFDHLFLPPCMVS